MKQSDGGDLYDEHLYRTERKRSETVLMQVLLFATVAFLSAAVGFRWYVNTHPHTPLPVQHEAGSSGADDTDD